MKFILTGATGLVGGEVLRLAIADESIEKLTLLTRKPPRIEHPKIKTVIHNDFLNYEGLEDVFKENDACIWCLGISVSQVNKEQYHVITYDYAMAAAKAMLSANPDIHFIFLSGSGADQTEKSRLLFERVKGKTEKALAELPFRQFHIARPGAIKPINKNPNAPFLYKLFYPIYPLFELLTPSKVITSVQVGKALLKIAKSGADETIIENVALKEMAG